MATITARPPVKPQNFIGAPIMSTTFSDMVFGYLEEITNHNNPIVYNNQTNDIKNLINDDDEDEDEDRNDILDQEKNKSYWETQHQVLQTTLSRSSSFESRIRNATKIALKEIQSSSKSCGCEMKSMSASPSLAVAGSRNCKNCIMREVSTRLGNDDFDSAICKTKWRNSPDIPSGEHTFMDVVGSSSGKKGEVRVVIELNFRAEFEMARATEDYNRLVRRLPEVFVGKVERLSNVVKILCNAAKKCMKEKRMHLGPWRKQKYMEAKWLSSNYKRTTSLQLVPLGFTSRVPKPRASMLTVDLVDVLTNMHCSAVEVL